MSDKKRPGAMSDEARALDAMRRRREEASGSFEVEDHFTPVSQVIERAADLTDRERMLLRYIWTHTANMEMRARARSDSQDSAQLRREIDALQEWRVDVVGQTGANGRLGALKGRVDVFMNRAWAVLLILLGGVAGAAVKLIIVGRAYGELETQVEANRARLQLLEGVVFLKSEKEMP